MSQMAWSCTGAFIILLYFMWILIVCFLSSSSATLPTSCLLYCRFHFSVSFVFLSTTLCLTPSPTAPHGPAINKCDAEQSSRDVTRLQMSLSRHYWWVSISSHLQRINKLHYQHLFLHSWAPSPPSLGKTEGAFSKPSSESREPTFYRPKALLTSWNCVVLPDPVLSDPHRCEEHSLSLSEDSYTP